jgi:branched-chain amino acid transport system ATP-binding protein
VAGLNLAETDRMGDTLQKINEAGVSLILVEHDMGLVMRISDQVVVLHFGQKIAEGTCHDVQNHPDVIHIYLGGAGKELGPIA